MGFINHLITGGPHIVATMTNSCGVLMINSQSFDDKDGYSALCRHQDAISMFITKLMPGNGS